MQGISHTNDILSCRITIHVLQKQINEKALFVLCCIYAKQTIHKGELPHEKYNTGHQVLSIHSFLRR